MIYDQITKQAVDFQKTAFGNWCNAVAMIQDQSATAMEVMISQSGLPLTEAASKVIEIWVDAFKEGFKRFHLYVEGGFSSIEKYLVQDPKAVPAGSPKLLTEEKKAAPVKSPKPVAKKKAAPVKNTSPVAKRPA